MASAGEWRPKQGSEGGSWAYSVSCGGTREDAVEIEFPFKPYPCQETFMEKVIQACVSKEHALLESPTGTGKTLCLLCASLAFVRTASEGILSASADSVSHNKLTYEALQHRQTLAKKPPLSLLPTPRPPSLAPAAAPPPVRSVPRVVYASRTHSQLQQVAREARRTAFFTSPPSEASAEAPGVFLGAAFRARTRESVPPAPRAARKKAMRVAILGSRDNLCVHAIGQKLRGAALNLACKKKLRGEGCRFYNGSVRDKDGVAQVLQTLGPMDIEDLKACATGCGPPGVEKVQFCPFYTMRDYQEKSDLVLLPYNYLLDPSAQLLKPGSLANSIVIIDEAHNVEQVAEDASSFELRQMDIGRCINALAALAEILSNRSSPPSVSVAQLLSLQQSLGRLDEWITSFELSPPTENLRHPHALLSLEQVAKAFTACSDFSATAGALSSLRPDDAAPLFSPQGKARLDSLLAACMQMLQDEIAENENSVERHVNSLDNLRRIFNILYAELTWQNASSYRVYLHDEGEDAVRRQQQSEREKEDEQSSGGGWSKKKKNEHSGKTNTESDATLAVKPRCLAFWSMSPAPAFASLLLQGARSIICTSGTLAPLLPLAQRLTASATRRRSKATRKKRVWNDYRNYRSMTFYQRQLENKEKDDKGAEAEPDLFSPRATRREELDAEQNETLISTFQNRNRPEYLRALGFSLLRVCTLVSGGVLCFFASYAQMHMCVNEWKKASLSASSAPPSTDAASGAAVPAEGSRFASFFGFRASRSGAAATAPAVSATLFDALQAVKDVFVEPANSRDMAELLTSFQASVQGANRPAAAETRAREGGGDRRRQREGSHAQTRTGAVLLAVCKGKAAEGIDFSDHFCRAVVICGLPLASYFEPRVQLKRMWLDDCMRAQLALETKSPGMAHRAETQTSGAAALISGRQWYDQEARRAVNQAVGRVVRHAQDFGLAVFLDRRFATLDLQKDLPAWVRRSLALPPPSASPFAFLASRVRSFFAALPASLLQYALGKMQRATDSAPLSHFLAEDERDQAAKANDPPGGFFRPDGGPAPAEGADKALAASELGGAHAFAATPKPTSVSAADAALRCSPGVDAKRQEPPPSVSAEVAAERRRKREMALLATGRKPFRADAEKKKEKKREPARVLSLAELEEQSMRLLGGGGRDRENAGGAGDRAASKSGSSWTLGGGLGAKPNASASSARASLAGDRDDQNGVAAAPGVPQETPCGDAATTKAEAPRPAAAAGEKIKDAGKKAAADLILQVRRLMERDAGEAKPASTAADAPNSFFTFCICMRQLGSLRGKAPAEAVKGYREIVERLWDLLLPLPVEMPLAAFAPAGIAASNARAAAEAGSSASSSRRDSSALREKKEILLKIITSFVPAAHQRDLLVAVDYRFRRVVRSARASAAQSLGAQQSAEAEARVIASERVSEETGAGAVVRRCTGENGLTDVGERREITTTRGFEPSSDESPDALVTVCEESEDERDEEDEPAPRPAKRSRVAGEAPESGEAKPTHERGGSDSQEAKEKMKGRVGLCLICSDDLPLHRSLNCGHEFCLACWTAQLQRRLECPVCRARTREKHLVPA
ncbi:hypothetical protein BESB_023880 [Besnoitia besnoiti]|uniref:Helicase n=1 Tax=Besnoitia besnoiti TaxID=94643 RepID=A0A2A9M7M1_BESBE|nr:hypothetical protein BESB_023880 [Besnoitia besnoiti]PFH31896.1 hypothetical protein BESB_023880 [Besnoitia besnoiti]